MLSETPPPSNAPIDRWVDWLSSQRQQHFDRPLKELLSPDAVNPAILLDLVCVDLIEQIRRGYAVRVEDYLEDFDTLTEKQETLDLVDAELCVRRELKEGISVQDYEARFPQIASEIRELFDLEPSIAQPGSLDTKRVAGPDNGPPSWCNSSGDRSARDVAPGDPSASDSTFETHDVGSADDDSLLLELIKERETQNGRPSDSPLDSELQLNSFESSGDTYPDSVHAHDDAKRRTERRSGPGTPVGPPVDAPPWFTTPRCLNSGQGQWLLRGRDKTSGDHLAMKIIELPSSLSRVDRKRTLDLCEQTSRVNHPSWVLPRVAAIESHYLAIIRPWVFGTPLSEVLAGKTLAGSDSFEHLSCQLRLIATAAYSVSSAHSRGATHGGLHNNNLLVDHEGRVQVIDAASSKLGWRRWLTQWNEDSTGYFEFQRHCDFDDLLKLVATQSNLMTLPGAGNWLQELSGIATGSASQPDDDAAVLADELMRQADHLADNGCFSRVPKSSRLGNKNRVKSRHRWTNWFPRLRWKD